MMSCDMCIWADNCLEFFNEDCEFFSPVDEDIDELIERNRAAFADEMSALERELK